MGLDISVVKDKVNLLSKLKANPELIFTDMFTSGVYDTRLYQNIEIDGLAMNDYLENCLSKIDVFRDVIVKCKAYEVHICMKGIECSEYSKWESDNLILTIDLNSHTYSISEYWVNYYNEIMESDYKLEVEELSDFWKRYENYNFSKKMKNACDAFKKRKQFLKKFLNFFIEIFYVSKKKVDKALDREKERIKRRNETNARLYANDVARQQYFRKVAPQHIQSIIDNQTKIKDYLDSLSYQEKEEEDN